MNQPKTSTDTPKIETKKTDIADIGLFVRASAEDIVGWDINRIVSSITKETGLSKEQAICIAKEVEQDVLATEKLAKNLTSSLIRELVNARLIAHGFIRERAKYARLGVPSYDVYNIITSANKENANVPHNPEATNLTLAETIKKEFALLHVFSKDVADAHMVGDIHLHDLGFIDRSYSFMPHERIYVNLDGQVEGMSFEQLFNLSKERIFDNGFEIGKVSNCEVLDKEKWTKIKRVVRHLRNGKKILKIETKTNSVCVTYDHPMILSDGEIVPAHELKIGQTVSVVAFYSCVPNAVEAYGNKAMMPASIISIEEFTTDAEFVYDITTESGTFICNEILVHNCSGQSLEYVKKFGLDLPNSLSIAKPAKYAETLLAHLVKFSAALQGHFAGAIGWDAVNLFFAPFLEGKSNKEIHQIAQMLVYEYSQQAVARGGQAIFSDLNVYWEVPAHFREVEAIGPGGTNTGKKYKEYEKTAQKFVWSLFDVYMEGDGCGRPFFFPKPLVHITKDFFTTEGHEKFLSHVSGVASKMGNPYFVFDRGGTAKISECCRLSFELDKNDLNDAKTPWKMRYSAIQNVTLNLPRAAYKSRGSIKRLYMSLDKMLDLAVKAHMQKRVYLDKLLMMKDKGPLAMLAMKRDDEPYLRMNRATHLIGLLGLNEMVQSITGKQMHEDQDAYALGVKTIQYLSKRVAEKSKQTGIRFVLEQTPAESTSYRMARLDLDHNKEQAEKVVKGDLPKGEVYYTNSTQINISSNMTPMQRVLLEGRMHPYISAGALTHIWTADSSPSGDAIAGLVRRIYRSTQSAQVAFSPEFTICCDCEKVEKGLVGKCCKCKSTNIDHITRVTGYFSRVSGWNKGKTAELRDRWRTKEDINSESNGMILRPFLLKRSRPLDKVVVLGKRGCQRCGEAKKRLIATGKPISYRSVNAKKGERTLRELGLIEHATETLPLMIYHGQLYTEIGRLINVIKAEAKGEEK